MFGDRPGARLSLSQEEGDVLVIAVDVGDNNTLALVAISAPGEMREFETTILAVAATVTYTPAWRAQLYGHEDYVRAVTCRPGGLQLASASDDGTGRVWDVASGAEVAALQQPDYVASVA